MAERWAASPPSKRPRTGEAAAPAPKAERWTCLGCRMTHPARRTSCPGCVLPRGARPMKDAPSRATAAPPRQKLSAADVFELQQSVPAYDEVRGRATVLPQFALIARTAGFMCGFNGNKPTVALEKYGTPQLCADFTAGAACSSGEKCVKLHLVPAADPASGIETGCTVAHASRPGSVGRVVCACAAAGDGVWVGVDWGDCADVHSTAELHQVGHCPDILVRRIPGESLGIEVDRGMVLTGCATGSVAAAAGAGGFVGARLDKVNGEAMVGPSDIPQALRRFPAVCCLTFGDVPAHQLLGVERIPERDVVSRAFRKLAAQHHPDKNPDDRAGAEKRMKRLVSARDQLVRASIQVAAGRVTG
eukprot:TRINITY_DN28683_c0_g1_i1.p1 TRINITY_DN28683_c0_g1~~TRINITY_DN28683_c0_g1_i1.p1  ORF type:complete len:376 (+),score=107.93 TRINITY_DN28683_c0_g1_i1:48-1130(+)